MDWDEWKDKNVFLKLRDGSVYTGKVIDVDAKALPLIWISLIDKYNELVTISHAEIIKIKEEDNHEV